MTLVEVKELHAGGWRTVERLGPFEDGVAHTVAASLRLTRDCTKNHGHRYPFKDCNATSGAVILTKE